MTLEENVSRDVAHCRKVVVVVGTRPEAIKMAPVYRALREEPGIVPVLLATGQHEAMLERALADFDLRADANLRAMTESQSLDGLTARLIAAIGPWLRDVRPDLVLVHGDTTSALCGALAAFYHSIPVGHVEAGLRTGDKLRPFPEEMNRILVDDIADLHFAPTEEARRNLLRQALLSEIHVTGNTVVDSVSGIWREVRESGPEDRDLRQLTSDERRLLLVTSHRRESFDGGLRAICAALRQLAVCYRDRVCFVYPVHPNPRVREATSDVLSDLSNVHLLPALGYRDFVWLLGASYAVLTDSGGVQEEAAALDRPTLVLRDVTERPEAVDAGAARLAGTSKESIVEEVVRLLEDPQRHQRMTAAPNPFGDGTAGKRIARLASHWLGRRPGSRIPAAQSCLVV